MKKFRERAIRGEEQTAVGKKDNAGSDSGYDVQTYIGTYRVIKSMNPVFSWSTSSSWELLTEV